MTEAVVTTTEVPAIKPKRRKAARAKAPAAPKKADTFAGLTKSDCASGCDVNGCVISGKPYCGHPAKGGLQTGDLGNREAAERLQQAIKYLKRKAAA